MQSSRQEGVIVNPTSTGRHLAAPARHHHRRRGLCGDPGAAGGAGGARPEPRIDAADVEAVAAPRQHAQVLPVGELREAYHALGRRGGERGAEGDGGERVDGLPLEALGRRVGRGGAAACAAACAASGDEGEAEDADERAEEGGQDDHHVGVHGQRLLLLRRQRRWRRPQGRDLA